VFNDLRADQVFSGHQVVQVFSVRQEVRVLNVQGIVAAGKVRVGRIEEDVDLPIAPAQAPVCAQIIQRPLSKRTLILYKLVPMNPLF
jgi:hypothetical protein